MENEQEKRKAIRIRKPLAVQFRFVEGNWDMSLINDISENGICINTGVTPRKDDIGYLRFRTPTNPNDWVELTAKVVDSTQTRGNISKTRLEFFNLDDEQKRLLREYVAWVLTNERSRK